MALGECAVDRRAQLLGPAAEGQDDDADFWLGGCAPRAPIAARLAGARAVGALLGAETCHNITTSGDPSRAGVLSAITAANVIQSACNQAVRSVTTVSKFGAANSTGW